jgi:hypothetical protein
MSDTICVDTHSRVIRCIDVPAEETRDTAGVESPRETGPETGSGEGADLSARLRTLTGTPRLGSTLPLPARGAEADWDLVVSTSRGDYHVPGYRVSSDLYRGVASGNEVEERSATGRPTGRVFTVVRVTDAEHPERSGIYLVPSSTSSIGVVRAHLGGVRAIPAS